MNIIIIIFLYVAIIFEKLNIPNGLNINIDTDFIQVLDVN